MVENRISPKTVLGKIVFVVALCGLFGMAESKTNGVVVSLFDTIWSGRKQKTPQQVGFICCFFLD